MKASKWSKRIQRAAELEAAYPFTAEVLRFYRQLAAFQQSLYSLIENAYGNQFVPRGSRLYEEDPNLQFLLAKVPDFLSLIETISPRSLAESARQMMSEPSRKWAELLAGYWSTQMRPKHYDAESLIAQALLQPYAEFVADHTECTKSDETLALCPFCRGKPLFGVLHPEGDGGKRSLVCSLCLIESKYGRIRCAACGEETVEKLAIYTSDQFRHVRVEACDSCHAYIKTIDMTKDGLAVPIVDELATLPLDLWAQEDQYVKLQPNLLGI